MPSENGAADVDHTTLHLEHFNEQTLTVVAGKLTTSDLARMRAVSKIWKEIVDLEEVRKASFRGTWGLERLSEEPRKPNFYLAAGLGHFVIRVKQSPRASLASILVRFKTDSVTIRVVNNCTSDFSLQCRTHIYVPVKSRTQLLGRHVAFVYDPVCCRQLVVLQEVSQEGLGDQPSLGQESSIAGTMDALARGSSAQRSIAATVCELDEAELTDNQREALLKKLSRHMGKGLNIDEGTAAYYLDLASGDMKKAFLMYKEDEAWEDTNGPVGILPLRERTPL